MTSVTPPARPSTYLFVPGNRPERFQKALASRAGAVIVDLEDAVAPGDKAGARASFVAWYPSTPFQDRVLVRINDESTPWYDDDIALIRDTGVRGVIVPKAETSAQIERVGSSLPPEGFVIALVETAKGIVDIDNIARAGHLRRIAFGTLDYALDLDIPNDDRSLLYPGCRIALASRAAGIDMPIAGVTPEVNDESRLLADLAFARACGFGAKLCIHPKQVEVIEAALRPSPTELDWAKRVVAAAASGQGAIQIDGRMVDRPVIAKARRILGHA